MSTADSMSVYSGLMDGLSKKPVRPSTWSVGNLMLTSLARITSKSRSGVKLSASTVQIVESLLLVFLCRRSLKKLAPTQKQLNSLVKSFRKAAGIIQNHETPDNREQDFVKYWLNCYLCRVMGDPVMPVKADWINCPLFGGWSKKLIDRAILKRDVEFINSLVMSKLHWPPLGDIRKTRALEKHKLRLSRTEVKTLGVDVPNSIGNTIYKTALLVFAPATENMLAGTKFMPSGSACVQKSRREGGKLALYTPLSMSPTTSSKLGKLRDVDIAVHGWRESNYRQACLMAYATMFDYRLPLRDRNPVDIIAIAEPSKFRIISKANGFVGPALQPQQGRMLDAWKRRPESTMLLTDVQMCEKVNDMLDGPALFCGEELQFNSVDYEAATDLIERGASLACYLALKGDPLYELGLESLLNSEARYPDGSTCVIRQGQLMGHELSFPMLCVINLSAYRQTCREVYGVGGLTPDVGQYSFMMNNVLVNGDDMLFRGTRTFSNRFCQNALKVGLTPSVGKNYRSLDVCMINSQIFQLAGGRMCRRGYLNQRLIYGSSAKKGDSEALPTSIGRDLSKVADMTPWTAAAIPIAMRRFGPKWSFGFQPNWYLPVHLGGYGVDLKHAPTDTHITRSQRLIAARFVNDPQLAIFRMSGNCLPLANFSGALANWRVVRGGTGVGRDDYVDFGLDPGDRVFADPGDLPENLIDRKSDAWLARVAYVVRAQHGGLPASPDSVALARSFRRGWGGRFRPMSVEGLLSWWTARLVATSLPECPPLRQLRVPTFLFDSKEGGILPQGPRGVITTPRGPKVPFRNRVAGLGLSPGSSEDPDLSVGALKDLLKVLGRYSG